MTGAAAAPVGRVTAADVAREAGVSRATVGFVLNSTPGQSISSATQKRVHAAAERLGYRPHTAAQALARGRSSIVLLVLPDWPMGHSMRTHLDEAALALDQAGYSLVTMTRHAEGKARPLWELLNPDVVIGLVPFTESERAEIHASGVRRIVPEADDEYLAGTKLGYSDGPRLQIEHLHERGYRRIAFAGPTDPRLETLHLQRRDLADSTAREVTGTELAGAAAVDPTTVTDVVGAWLAAGVDAVAAYNDDIAALVLREALRRGIRVPEHLAIIGHDDAPMAELFFPALSSVRVDTAGLGRYLAELALQHATDLEGAGSTIDVRAALVPRETS